MDNFKLVRVDSKYCDYLRKFDSKVSYNKNTKELRPFVGVIFWVNSCEYFVPLSSPKAKHFHMHNTIDFIKLDAGRLGALNLNNMIPVRANNYQLLDLNKKYDDLKSEQYYKLLNKQLRWLNSHANFIRRKTINLYSKYINNELTDGIKRRCCNYLLLEEKCLEYNKENIVV